MNNNLIHRLRMFILLQREMDKWSTTLLHNVNHEFKFKLNNYIRASDSLSRFMSQYLGDDDTIDDVSEVFSSILGKLTDENCEEFIALCTAYFSGDVEVMG